MGKEYTTKLMEHLRTLGSCSFIRPVYTEDETRHAAFQITLDDRVAESLYEHITRSFPVNAGVFAHIEYGRDKNSDDYVFEVVPNPEIPPEERSRVSEDFLSLLPHVIRNFKM